MKSFSKNIFKSRPKSGKTMTNLLIKFIKNFKSQDNYKFYQYNKIILIF
jgi:hypothetical protein